MRINYLFPPISMRWIKLEIFFCKDLKEYALYRLHASVRASHGRCHGVRNENVNSIQRISLVANTQGLQPTGGFHYETV